MKIYYILDLLNANSYFFELLEESELYATIDALGKLDWFPRNPENNRPGDYINSSESVFAFEFHKTESDFSKNKFLWNTSENI